MSDQWSIDILFLCCSIAQRKQLQENQTDLTEGSVYFSLCELGRVS